ncbi:MAG: prephenate dehydratase [Actinobacteria bacterium]|nr:prephenate dehydratase [Actinomycetota bacterium]MBI3688793.1 prephenate dehydratase [Actinomycetota bacterium]
MRTLPESAGAVLLPQPTVSVALDAVRSGDADAAVVPLENSVEGSVAATLDELAGNGPLVIRREVYLPVSFALLARPGTTSYAEIRTVATHPHAEAQCRRWLRAKLPHAQVTASGSTAAAAAAVAAGEIDAAVSAPIAAARYGLCALATDLADNPGAVTRFVVVTRPGPPPPPTGDDRTSVVAYIRANHTGALLEVLTEFAVRGINLTRIESRPTRERIGQYSFSLDCEGHVTDARVGDALAALHRVCADVRYLGSYPRAGGGQPEPLRPDASDAAFAGAAGWLATVRDSGRS